MHLSASFISSGAPRAIPALTKHTPLLAAPITLVLASALCSRQAVAQDVEIDKAPRLDERTALMIEGQQFKLGVLAVEYGITDRVAVGVDPPAWAARAVLPFWVPNLHAEIKAVDTDAFALSVRLAGYYANLEEDEAAPGSLVAVPTSLFASFRLAPSWWLHGEGTYLVAQALGGSGDLDNADLNGAVAAQAAQLGAMLEYRLTQNISLTALGRYQPYTGNLVFEGSGTVDEFTTVRIDGEMQPAVEHPWQAIGGVAFLWPAVRVVLGVGYGNYFVPGISIAMPDVTIVPDLSVSVVL